MSKPRLTEGIPFCEQDILCLKIPEPRNACGDSQDDRQFHGLTYVGMRLSYSHGDVNRSHVWSSRENPHTPIKANDTASRTLALAGFIFSFIFLIITRKTNQRIARPVD